MACLKSMNQPPTICVHPMLQDKYRKQRFVQCYFFTWTAVDSIRFRNPIDPFWMSGPKATAGAGRGQLKSKQCTFSNSKCSLSACCFKEALGVIRGGDRLPVHQRAWRISSITAAGSLHGWEMVGSPPLVFNTV